MRVSAQRHTPTALQSGKSPGTNFTGGWVSSGRSWHVRKASPSPGLEPRTVQPIASHYIDYATSISSIFLKISLFYVYSINSLKTRVVKHILFLQFLGVFAKLRKATVMFIMSVRPSFLRLHDTSRLPLDRFSWNLILEHFSRIFRGHLTFIKIWPE
jgi:hypothetical protein